jgi:hypothetical protein
MNRLKLMSKFTVMGTAVFLSLIFFLDNHKADAGETILRCTASPYTIQINHSELAHEESDYTYTAYDNRVSKKRPSLELSDGYRQDGHQVYSYIFNNGNYSHQVYQVAEGRGGQIFLTVKESGNQILQKQCK